MKKYIINGKIYMCEHVGIYRYAYNIICAVDKQLRLYSDLELQIVLPEEAKMLKLEIKEKNFKNVKIVYYKSSPFESLTLWQNICFPEYVRRMNGIAVCIGNFFPPLFPKGIVVVHDIMKITHPEWYKYGVEKIKSLANHRTHYSSKGGYITVSNHTHNEVVRYYRNKSKLPFLGIVNCAWNHMEFILEDESVFKKYPSIIKGDYFFTLGGTGTNRNFKWIYSVAEKFPDTVFVIAGRNDGEKARPNIIRTGSLSDGEIKALYKNCKSYLYPSLDEGFGITPLEALGCGASIIISDIPVFREIYKGAAHYIKPDNVEVNIERLLKERVDSPSEILSKYTWENAASDFLKILSDFRGYKIK